MIYRLLAAMTFTVLPLSALAAPAADDRSPAATFRSLCVAHAARMDEVLAAARADGFGPASAKPATPDGFTKVVALERGTDAGRQILVVSLGRSAISNAIPDQAPARGCAVTAPTGGWDVRAFAREWAGLPPLFDAGGTALYQYLERRGGNVAAPDIKDLPAQIAALNAGEMRTLAAAERGDARVLSWVVFEAPQTPVQIPAATPPTPSHDVYPFAPCRWENVGKGSKGRRNLSCPDKSGAFRPAYPRALTEETPTLARNGDVIAMLRLVTFYADGPPAVRDPAAAFLWSKRAADAGAAGGAFNTGLAYDEGVGIAVDKAEAARWYRIAADRNHAPAMLDLAALYLNGTHPDPAAAAALVRRAADAGSVDALYDMGHLAETGAGVPRDMEQAQLWYLRAADGKNSLAMLRLGLIHADGIGGVPRDDAQAARWLAAGVVPQLTLAQAVMALQSLVYGFDNAKQRARVSEAAAGDPTLALSLGFYLADRKNPKRDPVEALRLLRIAAAARIPMASMRIDALYAEGDGVAKDDAQAIQWFGAEPRLATSGAYQRVTAFTDAP